MIINRLNFYFLIETFMEAAALSIWFNFFSLTNYMSVEDYGTVDYILVLSNLIAIFVFLVKTLLLVFLCTKISRLANKNFQSLHSKFLFCLFYCRRSGFLRNVIRALIHLIIKSCSKLVLLQVPCVLFINFVQNIFKDLTRWKFLAMTLGYSSVHICILYLTVVVLDSGIEGS